MAILAALMAGSTGITTAVPNGRTAMTGELFRNIRGGGELAREEKRKGACAKPERSASSNHNKRRGDRENKRESYTVWVIRTG